MERNICCEKLRMGVNCNTVIHSCSLSVDPICSLWEEPVPGLPVLVPAPVPVSVSVPVSRRRARIGAVVVAAAAVTVLLTDLCFAC